jgi:chaperonin GroES
MIKPINNNIVIEPADKNKETTKSGLIIPETVNTKPTQGKVVAIGPGKYNDEGNLMPILGIDVGNTVLYRQYSGNEVDIENKKYVILSDTDVLAIIE